MVGIIKSVVAKGACPMSSKLFCERSGVVEILKYPSPGISLPDI
jgi:hypothetical protein